MNINTEPKSWEELLDLGVYYVAELDDDTGEPLYNIDEEKAKRLAPEVWQADQDAIWSAILDASDAGYLELHLDQDTFTTIIVPIDEEEA